MTTDTLAKLAADNRGSQSGPDRSDMSKPKPIAQVVAVEPAGPDGHGVNWLGGKPPKPGDLLYRAEDINQGRAGLRAAAQNALVTLDGIADTNTRNTADFETPDEWIAWAKSRARWAADALRVPVAQEIHAERILKQMMDEADRRSAFDTLPDDYEAPH